MPDGAPLTDRELLMFLLQLFIAGNETTRNTITGGLVAFAENPLQWLEATKFMRLSHIEYFKATEFRSWCLTLLEELAKSKAIAIDDQLIRNI